MMVDVTKTWSELSWTFEKKRCSFHPLLHHLHVHFVLVLTKLLFRSSCCQANRNFFLIRCSVGKKIERNVMMNMFDDCRLLGKLFSASECKQLIRSSQIGSQEFENLLLNKRNQFVMSCQILHPSHVWLNFDNILKLTHNLAAEMRESFWLPNLPFGIYPSSTFLSLPDSVSIFPDSTRIAKSLPN